LGRRWRAGPAVWPRRVRGSWCDAAVSRSTRDRSGEGFFVNEGVLE